MDIYADYRYFSSKSAEEAWPNAIRIGIGTRSDTPDIIYEERATLRPTTTINPNDTWRAFRYGSFIYLTYNDANASVIGQSAIIRYNGTTYEYVSSSSTSRASVVDNYIYLTIISYGGSLTYTEYYLENLNSIFNSVTDAVRYVWNTVPSQSYPITYRDTNCTHSGPDEATAGDEVSVTYQFPDGYGIVNPSTDLYVTNNGVLIPSTYADGKLTFTMPEQS